VNFATRRLARGYKRLRHWLSHTSTGPVRARERSPEKDPWLGADFAGRPFCTLKFLVFLTIFLPSIGLEAQDGWQFALLRFQSPHDVSDGIHAPSLASADFNHDGYLDGALLPRSGNNLSIEVYLRSDHVERVSFRSNRADLTISALDINHDGSPDLVVEDPFWRQRLFVWLNDGKGKFSAASVTDYPSTPHDNHSKATRPLRDDDSNALVESSKFRDWDAVGFLKREPSIPPLNHFIRKFVRGITLSHPAPNLVRGPPFPFSPGRS